MQSSGCPTIGLTRPKMAPLMRPRKASCTDDPDPAIAPLRCLSTGFSIDISDCWLTLLANGRCYVSVLFPPDESDFIRFRHDFDAMSRKFLYA